MKLWAYGPAMGQVPPGSETDVSVAQDGFNDVVVRTELMPTMTIRDLDADRLYTAETFVLASKRILTS